MSVKCFWDKQDIRDAVDWKETFRTALLHTCLFVPIVSEAGIECLKSLSPTDEEDNVLIEYEDALELKRQKRIVLFPILVGKQLDNGKVAKFDFEEFGAHTFPELQSPTKKPLSGRRKHSICETMTQLFRLQGVFLSSPTELTIQVKRAQSLLAEKSTLGSGSGTGSGSDCSGSGSGSGSSSAAASAPAPAPASISTSAAVNGNDLITRIMQVLEKEAWNLNSEVKGKRYWQSDTATKFKRRIRRLMGMSVRVSGTSVDQRGNSMREPLLMSSPPQMMGDNDVTDSSV